MSRGGWVPDASALALLETQAGPFSTAAFRSAVSRAFPQWQEASVGARAPDGTRAAVPLLRDGERAVSVPYSYGGVHASRALDAAEVKELLRLCRRTAGVRSVLVGRAARPQRQ